ncbi:hypothetical protein RQP53_02740 [Paucibacter sp. APW11]|uniref:Uncharacterized protein n=2 Tax=Roseateles aquae TaxID=3077235 RepID=A0ABU3P6L0_9BURK|nr:hypothetical protein [Paucibacter sp. APW11]
MTRPIPLLNRTLSQALLGLGLGLSLWASADLAAAQDASLSLRVAEPGFYGRVDIGSAMMPRVVYPQPVLVRPEPVYRERREYREPLYIYAPVHHQRHWHRHCERYGACGRPVYFVREDWVREVYVPRRHGHWRE